MKCRIARHVINLEVMTQFYSNVFGFEELGSFKNHGGYDGIFLGIKNSGWHIEFTQSESKPNHQEDADDFLVFYPTLDVFSQIISKIKSYNIDVIQTQNPYWNKYAIAIKDPEGHKICVFNPTFKFN